MGAWLFGLLLAIDRLVFEKLQDVFDGRAQEGEAVADGPWAAGEQDRKSVV